MIRSPFTLVGLAAGVLMVVVPTTQAQYTAQPRPADAPAQVGGASQANPQINTAPEQNQNPFAAFNNPATRLRMMKMAFLKISNGPGGRGGSPFGRGSVSSPAMLVLSSTEIQEELGLKDKQKQDLQTLADRAAQQRQDLFTQMRNQSRRGDNNAPGSSSNNNNGRGRGGPGGGVDFRTVMQTMQTMESQRDAKMLGVLTAKQRDRLEEIILQIEGPLAIATDSKVAKKVGVASSQNSKLKSVVANLQASLQPGGGPGGPGGPGGGPPGAPGGFQGRGGPGGPGGPAAAPGGFQGRGGPGGPGGPTAAPSGFQGRGGPGGPGGPGGQVAAGGFQGRGGPGGPTAAPGGPGGQVATGGGGERPSGFQGRSERGGDRGGDRGQRDPERDAERRQQFMDRMKEMMDSQDQAIAKAEADVEAILNPVQKQKFAKAKGKEVDLNAISESLAAATTSRFGRGGGQDGPPGSPTNSGSPREGTTTSSPAPRGR